MNLSLEILFYIAVAIAAHILVYVFVTKKKQKSIFGRHVVVTGGSKGIGLYIAVECAMKGANVTVIARDEKMLKGAVVLLEVLRQSPEQKFNYKSLDISQSYEKVTECFSEIEKQFGEIYMLVNCAGMAICGVFEEVSVEDSRKLMEINYFGTYNCTRHVLPKMKAAKEGIIVITASQAALFGIYGYGAYTASKYALRGMAETISMESRHLGVSVTLALPADTNTPGFENEEKTKPKETKLISGSGGLAQPDDVAKRIVNDALKGSFISIMGFESWLVTLLCGGMFPWGGLFQNIFHALVLGPLRIVGCFLQWHFGRIIRNCAKEKME
ncbi:3-ketodihydrosphingosine reductase [Eupeodes corollae]|uniref:3-ketodihydrosphingosine reductase n=1 Tax=Eupeodes corollae TaxID=290404 RepID=UPI0024914689|nr:3-ketodihydrosphingosine reductase [Eupeodes corollae]XP_055906275.1 3-ketodihydrosphingosine reductase [Eupeodes corollae]